ncbi:MAG: hypothetical protein D5R99_07050 [Methanocalculus sp. MSAO_Arc1]|nr:MAG: hypothetical protein D5R99_07050 [Methanocalculus sp. MSAO_Arc1]
MHNVVFRPRDMIMIFLNLIKIGLIGYKNQYNCLIVYILCVKGSYDPAQPVMQGSFLQKKRQDLLQPRTGSKTAQMESESG